MQPRSGEELNELEARQEPRLVKALEMVAPGTAVREGIDNIVHARTGGLIVIGDPDELAFLFSGGIRLDIDYTPALVYQLAKMDGAIALNANATKIDEGFVTTAFMEWRSATINMGPLEPGTYTLKVFEVSMEDGSRLFTEDKTFEVVP